MGSRQGARCASRDGDIERGSRVHTTECEDLEVEVWYDTATPFDADTATLWETFQKGTTSCTISGLSTSTLYYVYVFFRGPYGSLSTGGTDSDTTGASAGTLTAPDELFIQLGSNIGTRTAP